MTRELGKGFSVSNLQFMRRFYLEYQIQQTVSVRALKRQIDTLLFQRLLLSDGNMNKEKVLSLANEGITISKPNDILRDPYVFTDLIGV